MYKQSFKRRYVSVLSWCWVLFGRPLDSEGDPKSDVFLFDKTNISGEKRGGGGSKKHDLLIDF